MTNAEIEDLDRNLFAIFARQATRCPDALAVIDDTGATTYGALLDRANVIAKILTQRGLRAEQPVGVLMKRTTDLVATLLGILGAGGCYVPLDPDDPPERAGRIVEGAKCELVLIHKRLLPEFEARLRAANLPPELVEIENFSSAAKIAQLPDAHGGHRLAYILFTSGSTGLPKGVEVEHHSVVNMLLAARDLLGFTESDRYLATSTIGFDISVAEIFLPLITGGCVVLGERKLVLDPRGLARMIRDHNVTVFQTGPSVWSVLLAELPEFPRLRVAVSTGEAIAPKLARRLAGIGDAVWNLYGPTETTVWATGHRLERDAVDFPARSSVSAPIGQPLANVLVRVLDEHRTPVAPGTQGELWIGGEAVARGYCRDEALTHERFVELGDGSGTWFRTGDVVVQDVGGIIHYFGRNDDQIKVRGVRIEPMEVESAILTHPGVAQAAATWFAGTADARSIAAAVVVRPGHAITALELHHFLVLFLPTAMVPSRFLFCDALPMSSSGKVDRKAIRKRVADQSMEPAVTSGGDALTETERSLIGIWERTLNIKSVRRGDHFFSIGGDSLSAVTMMLEIEATFEISIPFRVVFEASTLDRLAAIIDQSQAKKLGQIKSAGPANRLSNSAFVFPLVQEGRGRPVFFNGVPGRMANQGMWNFDCPLYAVSQWAQGSGFLESKSMEELARVQLDGIRSVQPLGPYRLAGYSFGGLVALEIAQQLRRSGETVELLFLLDPGEPFHDSEILHFPTPLPWAGADAERLSARIKRRLKHLASDPRLGLFNRGARALILAGRIFWKPGWERICYWIVHHYGRHPGPLSTWLLPKNRWPAFWHASKSISKAYNPEPFDGEALAIFIAHEGRREMWQKLLGPTAESQIIDSDHNGLFDEPAISQWRQLLRAHLKGEK